MFESDIMLQVLPGTTEPLGVTILKSRGIFPEAKWYWIGVGAMFGYMFLFNFLFTLALTYLNRKYSSYAFITEGEKIRQSNLTLLCNSCSLWECSISHV